MGQPSDFQELRLDSRKVSGEMHQPPTDEIKDLAAKVITGI
jgi:HAMP domain-containing protein